MTVTSSVNRISAARLVYLDGAAAASDFPLSNTDTFEPGKDVEIFAGTAEKPVSIFQGMVVAQSLKLREKGSAQLIVECRHKAVKLTLGRKNACFFAQSDGDIITALLEAAHLDAEVENTSVVHAQQVQFRATDWDFLLARAEANGKMVFTQGDKVVVKAPVLEGEALATLQFGATILALDAHMDARLQWSAVKGVTWEPSEQATSEHEAQDPGIKTPGNLAAADLASVVGLPAYELRHAALVGDEVQAWADAAWLKSQLSRVSGRIKCEGMATVKPGDIINLSGVGQRYSGKVFVTGVRHDNDPANGHKTHIQFGSVEQWPGEDRSMSGPSAAALLPAVSGLQIGVVTSNEDRAGEHRVRVRLPIVDDSDGVWARVASLDAGNERGFFFRPEIGDEVVLGFIESDPRSAVILGMLHSSAKAAPLAGSDDNHEKVYQSRSKMRLSFNDEKKTLRLETPAGNKITLSEEDKGIKIEDQHGNTIALDADGIHLDSTKALNLNAGTDLKVAGKSAAELSSTAVTTVKGAQIKLN